MIEASRSFEHKGYATRRSHLMQVVKSPTVIRFADALLCAVMFAASFISLVLIGAIL